MARLLTQGVVIDGGASESTEIDLRSMLLRAVLVPSGWTAADIAVLAAAEPGGTFYPVLADDGTQQLITGAEDEYVLINKLLGEGLPVVKLSSVSTSNPDNAVAQGTALAPAVLTFDVSNFDFSGGSADLTFDLIVDGGSPQAVSITANTTNAAGFVAALDTDLDATVTVAAVDANTISVTTVSEGADSSITVDNLVDERPGTTLTETTVNGTDLATTEILLFTEGIPV